MKLKRCTDQKSSLEAFYRTLAENTTEADNRIGHAMLGVISRLKALPDERTAWGLTSHYHLCLLARNDSRSPWYVKVIGADDDFVIEYLMPERLAPWPHAYVKGEAKSEEQAVRMILTALDKSEGWKS